MEIEDKREIEAKPVAVWKALIDPETLQKCIPGCESMEGNPDSGFDAVIVQKVGPVKATFKCSIELSEVVPGKGCIISGHGKGGPAGFAKGQAKIGLEDFNGGTLLTYSVQARVGGKIAQLGSRIIAGFTKKVADEFFRKFQELIENCNGDTDAQNSVSSPNEEKKSWLGKIWSKVNT